jgi:hypothetical protein
MIIMNMAVYPITSLENIVNFIMKTPRADLSFTAEDGH